MLNLPTRLFDYRKGGREMFNDSVLNRTLKKIDRKLIRANIKCFDKIIGLQIKGGLLGHALHKTGWRDHRRPKEPFAFTKL
jgi:hypothetical protein